MISNSRNHIVLPQQQRNQSSVRSRATKSSRSLNKLGFSPLSVWAVSDTGWVGVRCSGRSGPSPCPGWSQRRAPWFTAPTLLCSEGHLMPFQPGLPSATCSMSGSGDAAWQQAAGFLCDLCRERLGMDPA